MFKEIYQGLYNRTGTNEPLKDLLVEVNAGIEVHDIVDVDKVTPDLVKKIIREKMKSFESDLEYDNLINAPLNLFQHLADFFRGTLVHGSVNQSLLICAIILLIKDKCGARGCH